MKKPDNDGFTQAGPIPEIFKFTKKGESVRGIFIGYSEKELPDDDKIVSAVIARSDEDHVAVALTNDTKYYFGLVKQGDLVKLTWEGMLKIKAGRWKGKEKNTYRFSYKSAITGKGRDA